MMTNQTFLAFYTLVMFFLLMKKYYHSSDIQISNISLLLYIKTKHGELSLNVSYEVYIAAYTL